MWRNAFRNAAKRYNEQCVIGNLTKEQQRVLMKKHAARVVCWLAFFAFISYNFIAIILLPAYVIWLKFSYFGFVKFWRGYGYKRAWLHKFILPAAIIVAVVAVVLRMCLLWLYRRYS